MRNDPDRPGERYLPRYMTSQGDSYGSQGYGCTTGGCSAPGSGCDGGRGSIGYGAGNQPRSNYWQHLDYLYQQYGSTAQRPRRRSSQSSATPERAQNKATSGAARIVWVSRNVESKHVSVLFVEPPAAQADKFFKGKATLTPAMKITHVIWDQQPEWSAEFKLAGSEDRDDTRS